MVIRHIRRRGRLTKEMRLARTERTSLIAIALLQDLDEKTCTTRKTDSWKTNRRSHLADAFLRQRRPPKTFGNISSKPVTKRSPLVAWALVCHRLATCPIRQSLLQRHLPQQKILHQHPTQHTSPAAPLSITPPLPHQNPTKSFRDGHTPDPTSIHIAQAWTNRGPYGREPYYRAFGRLYSTRPPHTGLSVLLKLEETRTREKMEKEAKAIRRRIWAEMWTQLPDRKVQGPQGQYVLW